MRSKTLASYVVMLIAACLIQTPALAKEHDSRIAAMPGDRIPQTTFFLSAPTNGATNQPLELTLGWTVPDGATEYQLQVSESVSFSPLLFEETVPLSTTADQGSFDIKKKEHELKPGATYFWRVFATLTDGSKVEAKKSPFRFQTAGNFFEGVQNRGFKLQKALSGPDTGELAEFSFLNTIGENTVYSSTFALSWQTNTLKGKDIRIQASVEGALASNDSDSEDAWMGR